MINIHETELIKMKRKDGVIVEIEEKNILEYIRKGWTPVNPPIICPFCDKPIGKKYNICDECGAPMCKACSVAINEKGKYICNDCEEKRRTKALGYKTNEVEKEVIIKKSFTPHRQGFYYNEVLKINEEKIFIDIELDTSYPEQSKSQISIWDKNNKKWNLIHSISHGEFTPLLTKRKDPVTIFYSSKTEIEKIVKQLRNELMDIALKILK